MKQGVDCVRYPHSASLFQFCRRVLDNKFGNVRVIDQDVGQILGFDPADCSHWKKGKKNVRSVQAIKAIAKHLGIDESLVVDVASGELPDQEAFREYNGYGVFSAQSRELEQAKKEFYRRNSGSWGPDLERGFRSYFSEHVSIIDQMVKRIHDHIDFTEAPLYLPEVLSAFPELEQYKKQYFEKLVPEFAEVNFGDVRPFVRFSIAKSFFPYFMAQHASGLALEDMGECAEPVRDIESNLFAAKLLAPAQLLRGEMNRIDVSRDLVGQLAETFWVSKPFMNRRLRDVIRSSDEF